MMQDKVNECVFYQSTPFPMTFTDLYRHSIMRR